MLVMKAIVYDAPRKFEYRDISVLKIQANEILLRVRLSLGLGGNEMNANVSPIDPNQLAAPKCKSSRG